MKSLVKINCSQIQKLLTAENAEPAEKITEFVPS